MKWLGSPLLGIAFLLQTPLFGCAQAPARNPAIIAFLQTQQVTGVTTPSFEIASIHRVEPHAVEDLKRGDGLFSTSTYPATRFFMHNTTLDFLVAEAYGIDLQYIQKDQGWMDSQLYDIDAKVDGERPLSQQEIRPLLRNLVQQRFHLAAHIKSNLVPGFFLVADRGAPKLKPGKEGGQPHAQMLPDRLDAQNVSASMLAAFLARPAGQPVIDKTGLTGAYDIQLTYAPANDPNSTLPSLFTAVREQLGLKLEPAKVPIDYLVIDHADRIPTEN
jgi:uncharacterized protein (TIGR03435 family)